MTEQEIIELVDTRVDMQTEIIMESSGFIVVPLGEL
jgi:hypothetical protein